MMAPATVDSQSRFWATNVPIHAEEAPIATKIVENPRTNITAEIRTRRRAPGAVWPSSRIWSSESPARKHR